MKIQKFKKIAIASAALALLSGANLSAQAQTINITQLHVLGDSLSDGGTYSNVPPVASGGALPSDIRYRFTNNRTDGKSLTWAEVLARELGIGLTPNRINPTANGGSNYAEGGSRVSAVQGIGYAPANGITTTPLTTQVDRLLAAKPQLGANDLVVLWIGANDAFTQFGLVSASATTPLAAGTAMATEAGKVAQQVQRLRTAGAQQIVVATLPALDQTPFGQLIKNTAGNDAAALMAGLGTTFNSALKQSVPAAGAVLVDTNKLLADVIANPARYGFNANVFGATACGLNPTPTGADDYFNSSLTCLGTNPNNYLFADGVHPSTQAHEIFGRFAMSGLRAIGQVAALAVGPMVAARQHGQALESRLNLGALTTPAGALRPVGDVQVFGGAEVGSFRTDRQQIEAGVDATTRKVSIGVDRMVAQNVLLGGVLSRTSAGSSFSQNTGSVNTTETLGILYATVALSPNWYVNAVGASGSIQHQDFVRRVELPVNTITATSNPSGQFSSFRVGAGWNGQVGGFKGGPYLSLTQEKVSIDAFTENDSPAALSFGATEFSAQRLTLGVSLMADGGAGQWRPFVRANIDRDLKSDPMTVRMGPSADALASVSVPRPQRNTWSANVGVARSDGTSGVWTVGLGVGGASGGGTASTIGLSYRLSF